jgi:predicted permease
MSHLLRDLRHAIRLLRRTPGFTSVAVLVLALGIGANTAVFSIVNALVLQPRPGRIDRLVGVFSHDRVKVDDYRDFSYPAYVDLRGRRDVFDSLMAHTFSTIGIREGDTTRRAFAAIVSSNYFETLGVPLAAGRPFTADEERPGSRVPVAIASYNAWRKAGLSPEFVGSRVRVNSTDFTVVGIARMGFTGTMTIVSPEWWFPLGAYDAIVNDMFKQRMTSLTDRGNRALNLAGALKPGVAVAAAERALDDLARRLDRDYPDTDRNHTFQLAGLPRMAVSSSPEDDSQLLTISALLSAMAGLVLLVACLNLANLLLARGTARRKEIAIRQALGSGRRRVIQQLLVEGLMLSLVGAAFGVVIGWSTTRTLTAWFSGGILTIGLDVVVQQSPRIVIAAGGFAIFSTLCFALGPAWSLSRQAVTDDLKGEPVRLGRHLRTGPTLVGAQIAVSLALVAAGGLFVRAAINAAGADPGFALEGKILAAVDPSVAGYNETQARALYRGALARLRSTPGVAQASLASFVPFGEFHEGRTVRASPGAEGIGAAINVVGSSYFDTLGLRMLRGREFTIADDEAGGPKLTTIDARMSRRLFGDADPIGRTVYMEQRQGEPQQAFTVVGVAPEILEDIWEQDPRPHVYLSFGSRFYPGMTLHVRAAPGVPEAAMIATVRGELQRLDSRLPIFTVRTMTAQRALSISSWMVHAAATLFSSFGGLALLLATIGIYGLKAYDVSRRTREIGIRMALGATAGDLKRLIVREGVRTTVAGLVLGVLMAAGIGKLSSSLLYRVSPVDPIVLATAAVVLSAAATLASYLPARRATRIAPLEALRAE